MAKTDSLTAARLREVLRYDPLAGTFTWIVDISNRKVGTKAGCNRKSDGRRIITIDGRSYYGANLAWLYMKGELPALVVDHEDRNASNDRWVNLRLFTQGQNCLNVPPRPSSLGERNIDQLPSGKYRVRIKRLGNGKRVAHVGVFDDIGSAKSARDALMSELLKPHDDHHL